MNIENKATFYDLWHSDRLGNRPRGYGMLGAAVGLPEKPMLLGLREHRPGGQFRVLMSDALPEPGPWPVSLSEVLPPAWHTISGEAQRWPGGWHLRYSFAKELFRDAMRSSTTADGLQALDIMRTHLGEWFEKIEEVEERHPGAVIEFTGYDRSVGVLEWPLIIWEVRHY